MEKGEKAVLVLQFALLLVVVLVIGNLLPNQLPQTPSFRGVYWGQAVNGDAIQQGGLLEVKTNATSIYAYFQLPPSTTVSSATAGRICTDPATKAGESRSYNIVVFGYNQSSSASYFVITPVGQPGGWSCTYSVQIKDSVGGVTNWSGTVVLKE